MHNDTNAIHTAEPIRGDRGASILGPRNLAMEAENPSLLAAPETDAGTVPNLKFSFSAARNRLATGGWAREITVRELPVSTELAGVNMRLKPGGIRELHWHKEAEWGFMLSGSARITVVDAEGRNFVGDAGVGDVWNFPAGIPHSIQGLAEGCEFILVFDNGNFSENETFLLTEWLAHTPKSVLAQNFGVEESAFDVLPKDFERSRWIMASDVPPSLAADMVSSPAGKTPMAYVFRLSAQQPLRVGGGQVKIVDSTNFPAASTIAAALVEVLPGAIRELHWHPNGDEWQYYIAGQGRMTVFASSGKARTFDFQAGDVGYVPNAMGHYVENTGNEPLRFLEVFRSAKFADLSLNQWIALVPPELLQAHVNFDERTMAALRKDKPVISAPRSAETQGTRSPSQPGQAVALLTTADGIPQAVPITDIVDTGNGKLLFALARASGAVDLIQQNPKVAVAILGDGKFPLTYRGEARVISEVLTSAPAHAGLEMLVHESDRNALPDPAERDMRMRSEELKQAAAVRAART